MIKRNIILICILIFVSSCGYTPIYKNVSNNKYNIIIDNLEGDELINSEIFNNLNRYKDINSDKKFNINISTTSEKIDIVKDISGKTSNYLVNIVAQVEIKSSSTIKTLVIKDDYNINNSENAFENLNYESSLKRNIASSFSQKIILQLINF
jgi:hypothetical protein